MMNEAIQKKTADERKRNAIEKIAMIKEGMESGLDVLEYKPSIGPGEVHDYTHKINESERIRITNIRKQVVALTDMPHKVTADGTKIYASDYEEHLNFDRQAVLLFCEIVGWDDVLCKCVIDSASLRRQILDYGYIRLLMDYHTKKGK